MPANWDLLTPQELQIAQLASTGLSNREIGQQLYLSHRTIGAHLYKIYPKLAISSRGQLREKLQLGGGDRIPTAADRALLSPLPPLASSSPSTAGPGSVGESACPFCDPRGHLSPSAASAGRRAAVRAR